MRFNIYSYRYIDEMSFVTSVNTYEEACKEIDRLAKERASELDTKSFLGRLATGDKVYYTFLPVGTEY